MHRRSVSRSFSHAAWALASLTALALASDAHALTTPLTGATLWPSSHAPLSAPFPAGARVRISSGYGPTNGSSLHRNVTETGFGNDHYALDLVYDGEPNGGRGMPIVAAASGTVVRAGWATAGWANFGIRVILRHDVGDGHVYHSLYAHLNALAPGIEEGVTVARGQVIGELGGSCQGALSCSSFSGPHLHFSVHRDSNVGGSGSGGSYGGNAVVPEAIDGYEDLMRGQVIVSMNTGTVECGDGYCNGDETNASCPGDCPVCEPVPMAGRAVDESELCFSRGGDPSYWREESDGFGGSLIWTHAIDGAVDNHGIWSLTFDAAGDYRLEVYTDAGFAQAQQAEYQITHDGVTDRVRVDQSAADGWQTVGEFRFAAGGGQQVRLDDATGEDFSLRRQLVFDAIRLTPIGGTPPIDAGTGSTDDASVPPVPPLLDGGVDLPADGHVGGTDAGGGGRDPVDGGCSASPTSSPAAPLWLLALGAAWLWRGSRRAKR